MPSWARSSQEGKAILIKDTAVDPRFMRAKSVVSTFRTALCVPLPGHDGRPVGMVQLDRRTGKKGFKPGDLDLLAALAVPVGVAVENHWLLKERASWAAAREIQLSLLPRDRPEVPGYAFWECYLPTLEVGGDLYDYIKVEGAEPAADSPARWAVTVGDVAGKGMPAALVVAGICPEVRHLVRSGVGPGEVLAQVNRHLCDRGVGGRFVTMAMTEIDPRSHQMTVVNAGHMDPLVRRGVGRDRGRGPLGCRHAAGRRRAPPSTGRSPFALEPGDLVVLYTDGVTESMDRDRQPFGVERLKERPGRGPARSSPRPARPSWRPSASTPSADRNPTTSRSSASSEPPLGGLRPPGSQCRRATAGGRDLSDPRTRRPLHPRYHHRLLAPANAACRDTRHRATGWRP